MAFNPTIWTANAQKPFIQGDDDKSIIDSVVREFDPLVQDKGEAVEVPVLDTLDEQTTGDTTVDELGNESSVNIPIDQESFVAFGVKNIDAIQANVNKIRAYGEQGGQVIRFGIDKNVAKVMATSAYADSQHFVFDVAGSGTGLTEINLNMFIFARQKLNQAKFSKMRRYIAITAALESQLFKIDQFISWDKVGFNPAASPITNGTIGKILGFNVLQSEAVPLLAADGQAAGTQDKNAFLAYQQRSTAAVMQLKLVARTAYNVTKRRDEIVIQSNYGRAKLRANGVISIRENT